MKQTKQNILRRKFSICWIMISLNQAKVYGVHFAFLYQNLMELIGCTDYKKGNNLSKTDTFPFQEWMTVLTELEIQNI